MEIIYDTVNVSCSCHVLYSVSVELHLSLLNVFQSAENVDKFNWFCHMWNHMQPHLYNNETHLESEMMLNKAFAEVSFIRYFIFRICAFNNIIYNMVFVVYTRLAVYLLTPVTRLRLITPVYTLFTNCCTQFGKKCGTSK